MTHKHTAGPWELEDKATVENNLRSVYGQGEVVALVPDYEDSEPTEGDANAHLIAAAPELLEACKGIESTFVFLDSLTAGWEPQHTNTVKALAAVRAAIAKAEGA